MNNYIYTLSNVDISIEKLHVCTWSLREKKASLEIGICIPSNQNLAASFDVYLFAPFFSANSEIRSLHEELSNAENFKFIFNEQLTNLEPLDDGRVGNIVHYVNNNECRIAIVNVDMESNDGFVKVTIHKPQPEHDFLYFRLFIKTEKDNLADVSKGITKKIYKFDFKINEQRNKPKEVSDCERTQHLHVISVSKAYCLHCVPDNFELSYSDTRKIQNVRMLEKDAFSRYLSELNDCKGNYIIAFQKDNVQGSCTFYTCFTREYIGNEQLFLAIIANIVCSFLFAEAAWRCALDSSQKWYTQIPVEWIALVILAVFFLFCYVVKIIMKNRGGNILGRWRK